MDGTVPKFIIIDTDTLDIFICKMQVTRTFPGAAVRVFHSVAAALAYVSSCLERTEEQLVLFVDLSLPDTSAWEFFDVLELLSPERKQQLCVNAISSSVLVEEHLRALACPIVCRFILKPVLPLNMQEIARSLSYVQEHNKHL